MRWLLWKSVVAGCLLLQAVATPQIPKFRPKVTVVPVDVRVFDKTGRPIDDLRVSDFQVFEDGKPQEIAFFSREVAPGTAGPAGATTSPAAATPAGDATTSAIEPRTFLIVLGRGRLERPFGALTALTDFVRTQVAPEDRIGVAAYDRIFDLTTDHEAVARLLIRYKDRHEAIENILSNYLSGLRLMNWDGVSLLPSIQAQIDRVFDSPDLPRLRRLPLLVAPDEEELADIRKDVLAQLSPGRVKADQDLRQLFTCAEFLRAVPGEKQLVFITDQPPNGLTRVDKLALLASDARIALSTINAGGLQSHDFKAGTPHPIPASAQTFDEMFSSEAFRAAARATGGVFSGYRWPAEAVRRLAERTSRHYVLAYYPPETKVDGRFHTIEVRMMRSDIDLSYRRGYFASDTAARADARAVVSSERVRGAYEDIRPFTDLPVELTVTAVGRRVDVSLKVDPGAVQFADHDGRKVATLEIAVAVGRSGKDARGHKQDAVDLSFDPAEFKKLTREKITYTTSVDVDTDPRNLEVKVVVYDYAADRVGTAVAKIR